MKTLTYTLLLLLGLCASNTKANTIHDISGTQGAVTDPVFFFTDTQGGSFSLTSGAVEWKMIIVNHDIVDQDHFIGFMIALLVSGNPSPTYFPIVGARQALAAAASQLEIQEYH